jgi:DNA-binding NarL/FixJ family response regulator
MEQIKPEPGPPILNVEPIRVLLVDDHQMFVEGLARLLRDEPDIDVVGTANCCAVALKLAEALQPSVAILDYLLPDGDGVTTAGTVRTVSPGTAVLLLTALNDSRLVISAIDAGCSGFLTKDKAFGELVAAVRLAHAGEAYLAPDVLATVLRGLDRSHRGLGSDLTVREHEVLQLLASGIGNKDIADQLDLSFHTVRNHVQNLIVKLGAHSKLQAVAIAAREGLVDRPGSGGSLE